ncbi:MAG: glycosyltransferase [Actinobacteria bacterium]|uniref:Unannotated protein n=1 Tax=freshwater metagenome TaxID=449393 RepID=A0A6J6QGN8_9ZZZZ|nr:glycosyltransferase [Actinomycetota bacterium]
MARIRILYVHHRSELGGAPTSLSYIIRNLDQERFEPHVFCPPGPAADLFRDSGAIVHTGVVASFTHIWASVYRGRRWLLFVRELLRLPAHTFSFRRLLSRESFDLVHLNDSPLVVAGYLAYRRKIPVIWHLRSALPDTESRRSRLLRNFIARISDASIAINSDVAESFGLASEVIPNSADLERFSPGSRREARIELGLDPERPLVSFFGFLYPSKGFAEFIHAAREVLKRRPDAVFMMVGGAVRSDAFFQTFVGKLLRRLDLARNYDRETRELIKTTGLGDAILLVPFTPDTSLRYRASDVVVAPSRGPELGRPVIEAASAGVPVVATGSRSGGGILVDGATGLLAANDAKTLAAAIASLVEDPDRAAEMGRAARAHAEVHFSPEASTRRMEDMYAQAIARARRTKILYVHHRSQLGGAPTSLAHIIRNLDRDVYVPHVFVPEGPSAELFRSAGAVVHAGRSSIFSHTWDSPYAGARWLIVGRELLNLPAHVIGLNRTMRKGRYPIVHLNDSPLLPAAWVAKRQGAFVVWHLRSSLAGGGRDRRSRVIARLIDRWGDEAVAIDSDVAATFPITLPVRVIPNSVVIVEPRPQGSRSALGLPDHRVLIGFAGFVRRQKGWPELVDAAAILAAEDSTAHFVIIGGGVRPSSFFATPRGRLLAAAGLLTDEEAALHARVQQRGLSSHFSFLPYTSDTALIYSVIDVMTFPNQGVGLGRPVLEAETFGIPVVASGSHDGGGVLVPGVTGVLLDDPTPAAIATALHGLIADPERRAAMGTAGREHALAHFDPVLNARLIEALYASLVPVGGSR